MQNGRDADILALIERLKADISLAQKHSLKHTIALLHIAVLDLETILHGISDGELRLDHLRRKHR
jgi:hypothetical protein